jgi:hypothetical protein
MADRARLDVTFLVFLDSTEERTVVCHMRHRQCAVVAGGTGRISGSTPVPVTPEATLQCGTGPYRGTKCNIFNYPFNNDSRFWREAGLLTA